MKIGILTFHHGYNYGGFLQVFSLLKYLEALGNDVEIINYINPVHKKKKFKMTYLNKNVFSIPSNIKKKNIFDYFHDKLLKTIEVNDIDNLNESFDLVILGSDEIWNYNNPMFGKDLTYFGKGIKTKKIISYAASFGTRTLDDDMDSDIIKSLTDLDFISVRDDNSFDIIKSYLNIEPLVLADPTFLIDQKEFIVNPHLGYKYLLFYGLGVDDKIIRQIKKYSFKNNLKIVSVGYRNNWCDENIIDINPFEWSGYIKNANKVVTSMFHGLVYSLIHQKDFVFIMNEYRKNKVDYIIKYLEISDQVLDSKKQNDISYYLDQSINYSKINSKLQLLINQSKDFLKKALKNEENN